MYVCILFVYFNDQFQAHKTPNDLRVSPVACFTMNILK